MSRHPLGWDYPAGAEHDPQAPWNAQDTLTCPECDSDCTAPEGDDGVRAYWTCEDCGHDWHVPSPRTLPRHMREPE